jgi:hypothetical protein
LADSFTFQNVRVSSDLSAGRMLLFALKMSGAALLWIVALGVVLVAILRVFGGFAMPTAPIAVGLLGLFVLLSLLAISVFTRTYYNGLLSRVVASLSFEGAPDLARIGQTAAPVPRWGEGMLEAFDFAA